DFVGWTALTPIAVLMEYIFGLRPDVSRNILVWDIRLTDEFGIKTYPFGENGTVDLSCKKRKHENDVPAVRIKSDVPLKVQLIWQGGSKWINVEPSKKTEIRPK